MLRPQQLLFLLLLAGAIAVSFAGSGHYHDTDDDGEDEHDPGYDQEQFLGKEAAREFSKYDTKVSEEKLQKLVKDSVDADKDGYVSADELLQHLEKVHREQQEEELNSHWSDLSTKDGKLDWATYVKGLQPNLFGERDDEVSKAAGEAIEEVRKGAAVVSVAVPEKALKDDSDAMKDFFGELVRQRRRWNAADADRDDSLTKQEYRTLLFPEEVPAMRDILVSETMDQMDRDRDGRLSLAEYLAGQWTPSQPGEKEPHWVQGERDSFAKKDANSDGFLDRAEVQVWIQPVSADSGSSLKEEAGHLIREADEDLDGRLSLTEVLKHRELFAGSKATRYGEDVMESSGPRDEL